MTAAAVSLALLASGCSAPAGSTPDPTASPTATSPAPIPTPSPVIVPDPKAPGAAGSPTPTGPGPALRPTIDPAKAAAAYGDVRGMVVEAGSGRVLLATRNGLFDAADPWFWRIGPEIDLKGFTAVGPGHFFASGHPAPRTGLADPAGLIESRDGGQTWTARSKGGESDFHTLTTTAAGLVGFDGRIRLTADGDDWAESTAGIRPSSLAGTPLGDTVLATTEEGVYRSTTSGAAWSLPPHAPVLLEVAFADRDTAVGVAPDGAVHLSADAGRTWTRAGTVRGRPTAVAALPADGAKAAGAPLIWVATDRGVVRSTDGGATFAPLVG